jgi:hypothetical protein
MRSTIVSALCLVLSVQCWANASQNFFREFGTRKLKDVSGTELTVTAKSVEQKTILTLSWRQGAMQDSNTMPLKQDGWFLFVESISRTWVFDGETLSLVHHTPKSLSRESTADALSTCPKEVLEALPDAVRSRMRL